MGQKQLEKQYWATFDRGVARGGVFGRYYDHLQRALLRCVDEMGSARGAAVPELTGELMEAYLGQMKRITLRTLLLEMEICDEEGSLKGLTGEEKYACFEEDFLGNPDYLREVYDAYPLMYEGVLRTLGDFVRSIREAMERFAEDREGINSRFFQGNPCRNIQRIGGGGSDAHRRGRRVLILEADNGERLVYKPRSLGIDEKYTAFLGWVFRGMGQDREMGNTEKFYRESVLQTGLLPLYVWNSDGEGINVSAINGKGGQMAPVKVPMVAEPGTINMHIEYRRPATREGKNLAVLDGEFIEPAEFLGAIQSGFGDAYEFLVGQKAEVRRQLGRFRDADVRYVARDTQTYFMVLQALGHPDMLTGEEGRKLVWDVLNEGAGETGEWIRKQERKELTRGDVPIFTYRPSGRRVYSGTGESLEAYFRYPVLECVERRLECMGAEDLGRQQNLIRRALLMGTKGQTGQGCLWEAGKVGAASGSWGTGRQEETEGIRIRAAERIGDILLENAIWSEDGKEVGWLSMTATGFRERSYLIRPMDYSLYGGLAGVALFMAELSGKTDKEKYERLRKVLVDMLFRHTDDLFQKKGEEKRLTGAYTGEASLAFAYMLLYGIYGDCIFLEYLRKQCQAVARGLEGDQEYDVLGGNAGAILVFLRAYRLTSEECYMAWAREAGDWLVRAATDYGYGSGWVNRSAGTALTGFAHGTAGIMLALTRLGHAAGEKKYLEAAHSAYRYEEHYYREDILDWEDLRGGESRMRENPGMAWCHGWGGIVLARMEAMEYADGDFREELEWIEGFAEKKLRTAGDGKQIYLKKSLCLCHGICGNMALMSRMGKATEEIPRFNYLVMKAIGGGEDDVGTWVGGLEIGDYGLLGGLAGIGYSCLCGEEKALGVLCVGW